MKKRMSTRRAVCFGACKEWWNANYFSNQALPLKKALKGHLKPVTKPPYTPYMLLHRSQKRRNPKKNWIFEQ